MPRTPRINLLPSAFKKRVRDSRRQCEGMSPGGAVAPFTAAGRRIGEGARAVDSWARVQSMRAGTKGTVPGRTAAELSGLQKGESAARISLQKAREERAKAQERFRGFHGKLAGSNSRRAIKGKPQIELSGSLRGLREQKDELEKALAPYLETKAKKQWGLGDLWNLGAGKVTLSTEIETLNRVKEKIALLEGLTGKGKRYQTAKIKHQTLREQASAKKVEAETLIRSLVVKRREALVTAFHENEALFRRLSPETARNIEAAFMEFGAQGILDPREGWNDFVKRIQEQGVKINTEIRNAMLSLHKAYYS